MKTYINGSNLKTEGLGKPLCYKYPSYFKFSGVFSWTFFKSTKCKMIRFQNEILKVFFSEHLIQVIGQMKIKCTFLLIAL